MSEKLFCSSCNKPHVLVRFHKGNPRSLRPVAYLCKVCKSAQNREYYLAHRQTIIRNVIARRKAKNAFKELTQPPRHANPLLKILDTLEDHSASSPAYPDPSELPQQLFYPSQETSASNILPWSTDRSPADSENN